MQYLLLIYDQEAQFASMSEKEQMAIYQEYMALVEELKERKIYIGGNPLKPTSTAATVRVRKGKKGVTDGPFAETKEQLGGYFLIEAKDLDEAIEVASRIPTARDGSIEVRPIQPIGRAQGAQG
ncbi:MAG TPA: YciI family protein [Dongiaceae bacterium]|nr:YciI family protein [Dongiaceae bacterium]